MIVAGDLAVVAQESPRGVVVRVHEPTYHPDQVPTVTIDGPRLPSLLSARLHPSIAQESTQL